MIHRLLILRRRTCRFIASQDVKIRYFIRTLLPVIHYLPVRHLVILHAYYLSMPLQHTAFHSSQNCYSSFFL